MTDLIKQKDNYRFERKFNITNLGVRGLEEIIRQNPFLFSDIYSLRQVNNVYFDSLNLKCFNDNISGLANRFKIRIRWYGKMYCYVKNPILEIKKKTWTCWEKRFLYIGPIYFF